MENQDMSIFDGGMGLGGTRVRLRARKDKNVLRSEFL
jgi:hypothetical protein